MAEAVENKGVLYEFGQYVLDPEERVLFADGQPLHLTDKVFDTLLYLLQNSGRLLTKDEMMKALWAESFVEESNLAKNISRLRKILNTDDSPLIETLPRRGYRFLGDVKEIDADTSLVIRRDMRVKITHTVEDADGITRKNGELVNGHRLALNDVRPESSFRRWRLPIGILGAIAIGSVIFAGFYLYRKAGIAAQIASGPLRLTNDPKHDTSPAWTKDGRIRFVRYAVGEDPQSLVMQADGTDHAVVKDFPAMAFGRWSPDEKKILFGKPGVRGFMYLADPDGSNEVALPAGGNHDWSFDSRMLVYQSKIEEGNHDIVVYSLETGKSENITNHPSFDADPSFSPDGKQVVFASLRDGNAEIYLMNIDGSNVRRLTNHPAWDCHPVFAPDGTAIAFSSNMIAENSDVFLMNLDGSNVRHMTDWPSDEGIGPGGWSHDGTQIAFVDYKDGNDDIYVKSAEVYLPRLVSADAEADLSFPSYSPDGERIVYQAQLKDKTGELRILDVPGDRTSTLLKTENGDLQPMYSRTAEQIAFQNKIDTNTEICLINADGTGFTNLTVHEARDASPAFSPDGQKVVFASNRGGNYGHYTLFVMNIDGTELHEVFATNLGMSISPTWSTNGSEILFANDKESGNIGNFEIYKVALGEYRHRKTPHVSASLGRPSGGLAGWETYRVRQFIRWKFGDLSNGFRWDPLASCDEK